MSNKILLTAAKARSFAETNWGRGGTHAYKTNRRGVYYFSCSGHGGYVVDADALTKEEYEAVKRWVTPDRCLVILHNGKVTFFQNPVTVRTQRYRVYPNAERLYKEVFFFEEDCAWAILEHFTTITKEGGTWSKEKVKEYAKEVFERWFLNNNERVTK